MDHDTSRQVMEQGYRIAQGITQEHAKTFSFAARFLPQPKRKAAYSVYAICRASDDVVDDASKKMARAGLKEMRANILAAYQDGPLHDPLLLAFRETVRTYGIPKLYFDELLQGMQMDLYKSRYADFHELYEYCYKVAGVVGLIMLHLFGFKGAGAKPHAVDLGVAMQLTNILRDIREDAARGRIYLPQEELAQYGVSETKLLRGESSGDWVNLLRFQIDRARGYYAQAEQGICAITSTSSRFVVYAMKEIYGGILAAIEENGYDVFSQRAHVSKRRKIRMALRILARGRYICGSA
jgi:phytoene synthase